MLFLKPNKPEPMKRYFFLVWIFLFAACKPSQTTVEKPSFSIRFLDDYVIPSGAELENTSIGGLSGIDYIGKNEYLLISDQKSNPRFYRATILLSEQKIDTVFFSEVILLGKNKNPTYENHAFDLGAIRQHPETKEIIISSEGNIDAGKNPGVYQVSPSGKILSAYEIPHYFEAKSKAGPQNNGVFEALSNSLDHAGIWVATELPLKADGPKPMLTKTTSPVRVTYFDKASQTAEKQFVYLLDSIAKIPLLPFHINGVTDILAVEPNKFLVVERQFSAGLGQNGNTVRIYEADFSKTTNTLKINSLKKKMDNITPAQKQLLFDFSSIKKQLSEEIIDNIEGISFGPSLPNGNKTLILVADNNFNSLGPQLNQIILLELIKL